VKVTRRRWLGLTGLATVLIGIALTARVGVINRQEALLLGVAAVFALALAFLDARARWDARRLNIVVQRSEQRIHEQLHEERTAVWGRMEQLTRTIDRDVNEVRAQAGRAVDLADEIGRALGGLRDVEATMRGVREELKTHDEELARRLRMLEERSERRSDLTFRMVEAIVALNNLMSGSALPRTRGWAASPDLLTFLYRLVLTLKPRQVVECGSGVSSLVIAHAMEASDCGSLVSLEHDEQFRATTRRSLAVHRLQERADVLLAPLTEYELGGDRYLWYTLPTFDTPIDLLFVDGPPKRTGPQARYPAIPLLTESLSSHPVIVLDDTKREDEAKTVERWRDALPSLEVSHLPHEKGTTVLAPAELLPGIVHLA
jgi:predicted O-methyltransferase YrrM